MTLPSGTLLSTRTFCHYCYSSRGNPLKVYLLDLFFIILSFYFRSSDGEDAEKNTNESRIPPHCHITIKCTREVSNLPANMPMR